MKVLKVICLSQMVMAAVRYRRRVSNACQDMRQEIEIEIENDLIKGQTPKWIIGSFETPIKKGCTTTLTYDQSFCTKVCELLVGEVCTPGIQKPGDDLCGPNLDCLPYGSIHTCQEIPDFSSESSFSSDYLYNWLNNPVYVPGLELLPDDYVY